MNFFTHLECGLCGKAYDADKLWNLCLDCKRPLLARYDLKAAKTAFTKDSLKGRPETLWRYQEMLPVRKAECRLSLGEGFTPLIDAKRLNRAAGFNGLYIKEEGVNPTTSFKARGLSLAVSRALELGVTALSIPSAGNAAGAMSAYACLLYTSPSPRDPE